MSAKFWHDKKVLVTGGAGFIGSHLSETLVGLGAQVRIVDNLGTRGRMENIKSIAKCVEFIKGDLTLAETARAACKDMEVVFHLASKVGGIGYYMNRPAEVYATNVLMDIQVFTAARAAQAKRFCFTSSSHVYPGRLQRTEDSAPLREEDAYPADPVISFGLGKLVTEKLIQYQNAEGNEMHTSILRVVGAYGERQDFGLETGSVIPVLCRRAAEFPKRSPFTMLGQGKETRSYCYVGDIVDGMIQSIQVLDQNKEVGPLNLGNEGRVTINEIAQMVIEASGKKIEISKLPAKESGIRGQAVDITHTQQVLKDWRPRVSLRDGILRTYRDIETRLSNGEQ
jgi:nucleoside-diphosphate-sugar epimerase